MIQIDLLMWGEWKKFIMQHTKTHTVCYIDVFVNAEGEIHQSFFNLLIYIAFEMLNIFSMLCCSSLSVTVFLKLPTIYPLGQITHKKYRFKKIPFTLLASVLVPWDCSCSILTIALLKRRSYYSWEYKSCEWCSCEVVIRLNFLLASFPWQYFGILHHSGFIYSSIKELTGALGRQRGSEEKTWSSLNSL